MCVWGRGMSDAKNACLLVRCMMCKANECVIGGTKVMQTAQRASHRRLRQVALQTALDIRDVVATIQLPLVLHDAYQRVVRSLPVISLHHPPCPKINNHFPKLPSRI